MLGIDQFACFFGALLLLTVPLNWLLAVLFAAGFHELCHIAAIILMGGRIFNIRIGVGGAAIETDGMTHGRELVCALAGPAGSLLLFSLCRWIPKIALCAGIQAVYNLFPVYPLDGGRVLRSMAAMLTSEERAELICRIVEKLFVGGAAVAVFLVSVRYQLGILPIMWTLALFGKAILRKIPCKDGKLGVQ